MIANIAVGVGIVGAFGWWARRVWVVRRGRRVRPVSPPSPYFFPREGQRLEHGVWITYENGRRIVP